MNEKASQPKTLSWFGFAIGVLTALSTHAGTTSTLIALLFALIGGSLVGWYRKSDLSGAEIQNIISHASRLALFLLIGIGVGFVLRFGDRVWIEPWISKKEPSALVGKREELNAKISDVQVFLVDQELARLKAEKPEDSDPQRTKSILDIAFLEGRVDDSNDLSRIITNLASGFDGDDRESSEKSNAGSFVLRSTKTSELKLIRDDLEQVVAKASDKQKYKQIFQFLDSWTKLRAEMAEDKQLVEELENEMGEREFKLFLDRIVPLLEGK